MNNKALSNMPHAETAGTECADVGDSSGRLLSAAESGVMINTLKNILNELDAYVYVSDMDTDEILFVNKKVQETFNIDTNQVGAVCWKIIQKGFTGRCSFCPKPKLEKDHETPVVWEECNTITGRYYKNTDSVIEWINGKKAHLQYAIDITENKALAQESAKMLSVLKNILNGMDAYVYVSDMVTDEILFINNRMKDGFGLDDSAVGKTCWKVLQDGFTERCSFCPNIRLAKDPGTPVAWEEHNTVTKRHYKNVDSVIEWMDGRKVHMQHSADITDILAAQGESREARERLEIALTSSQAGVWEVDLGARLLRYDAMCSNLFGFDGKGGTMTVGELIPRLEQRLRGESGAEILRRLRKQDLSGGNRAQDLHLVLPNGVERHIRNYGNTMRDGTGKALRIIGMCIDITPQVSMENDLKAAKDAAENASRAKSQFLSNMSHEIRTPMNAIIGMTDVLASEKLTPQQRGYLNDIKVSSSALLGIIDDILDFSKIEAGKLQLAPIDYSVMQFLKKIETMFVPAADAKGIAFFMRIQEGVPSCLYGDDLRMGQVLINIIGNAIKFTKKGGVSVNVFASDGMLCFDVSDTGIGIKEADLPRIFNDFDRLDLGKNRSIAGTGLGLAISKNLVSLMNGSIRIESEYGVGTTFYLQFPLVAGDESNLTCNLEEEPLVSAPDANILVVDDNDVNLNVASGLLRLHDISCDTASSGLEAIEKTKNKKYDIVFMDHMMPEMDGIEATRFIRQNYSMDNLVIIALTANAIEGSREKLMQASMNDYLSKPINKAHLNIMLNNWLPQNKIRKVYKNEQKEKELTKILECINQIEEFDVRLGLDRIDWMQDVYEKSAEILSRRLPETIDKLRSFLESSDASGFAIEVHGLKGSLGNMGATALAAAAEALEHKAKEGDLPFCRENLPSLTAALLSVHARLAAVFEEKALSSPSLGVGDEAALMRQLVVIRDLLDAFEGDEALAIVRNLSAYEYGVATDGLLRDLIRLIEEFEYDKATALIDAC